TARFNLFAGPYSSFNATQLLKISTSQRVLDEPIADGHIQPSVETQDVTALDHLVNVIRNKRADPALSSIMPMRSPLLWSETAFNEIAEQPTLSASVPVPDPPPTRSMIEPYSELVISIVSGGLRVGKLMEHLGSLAGSISYKHVLGPRVHMFGTIQKRGFFIVTAAVDQPDMLLPLFHHNWGKSSMEVLVKVELLGGKEETVLLGRFSMVCRDAFTQKARPVPQLKMSTPEEQALFDMGAAHKERRGILALRSLDRVLPSTEEAGELHQLYLNYGENSKRNYYTERVWMEDTSLENCILMFAQERNVHSKIFGGYLMRLACELGFTTAILFGHRHVRFLSLDGLSFSHPVPIGSILRLRSKVALTAVSEKYPALVHTIVEANVVDLATGTELTAHQ
ncbi:hypothetical protein M422DRAFT_26634, partial [Sphaerobolus stellatus SS14]